MSLLSTISWWFNHQSRDYLIFENRFWSKSISTSAHLCFVVYAFYRDKSHIVLCTNFCHPLRKLGIFAIHLTVVRKQLNCRLKHQKPEIKFPIKLKFDSISVITLWMASRQTEERQKKPQTKTHIIFWMRIKRLPSHFGTAHKTKTWASSPLI